MAQKIKLGILFGGRSCEHEVSIISALQLAQQANPFKYDIVLVYISRNGEWFIGDKLWKMQTYLNFEQNLEGLTRVLPDVTARSRALLSVKRRKPFLGQRLKLEARLDCVIPVFHGMNGEDGSLQGLLELMDLPYASTGVMGSAVGMDKITMKRVFKGSGFPVLRDCEATRAEFDLDPEALCHKIEQLLPYPVFVKPANLGSSIGVSRADDRDHLHKALELAFSLDRRALVEEGLDRPDEVNCSARGFNGEVEVSVVEMPVRPGEMLDFKDKYLSRPGENGMAALSRLIPAPIDSEKTKDVQELTQKVFQTLDCKGVVRVDYMIDRASGNLFITEINTIPGSLSFYLWEKTGEGLVYRHLVDEMVEAAFKAQAEKNRNSTVFTSEILRVAIDHSLRGAKS